MNPQEMKFGNASVDKKGFYSSKHTVLLGEVELDKIVVSNKSKINDMTCKYYVGYNNGDIIRPLCVIMPQMIGYIKYFDNGGKHLSFVSKDESVYVKYNEIWGMLKKLLKLKFSVNPVKNDKYICCKLKIFAGVNRSTFADDVAPMEKNVFLQ